MSRAFTYGLCNIATMAAALTTPCLKGVKTALQYDDKNARWLPVALSSAYPINAKGD